MAESPANNILRRKTSAGRRNHEARGMSPTRALRLALARSAEDMLALAVTVQGVRQEIGNADTLLDGLDGDAMLILLDGPDGATGFCAIGPQMLAALIEIQTIGRVIDRPAPPRNPTRTDAAMVAPLIDAALGGFAAALTEEGEGWWATGYRFGDMIEDLRTLALALEAPVFRSFHLTADFGGGAKEGSMVLALPDRPRAAAPPDRPAREAGRHAEALSCVPAEIDAVLCRLEMPLARAGTLKPGDLVPLPPDVLDHVSLRAGGHGIAIPVGLGQSGGFRAIRLLGAGSGEYRQRDRRGALAVKSRPQNPSGEGAPDRRADPPAAEQFPDLPGLDFDDIDGWDGAPDTAGSGEGPVPAAHAEGGAGAAEPGLETSHSAAR